MRKKISMGYRRDEDDVDSEEIEQEAADSEEEEQKEASEEEQEDVQALTQADFFRLVTFCLDMSLVALACGQTAILSDAPVYRLRNCNWGYYASYADAEKVKEFLCRGIIRSAYLNGWIAEKIRAAEADSKAFFDVEVVVIGQSEKKISHVLVFTSEGVFLQCVRSEEDDAPETVFLYYQDMEDVYGNARTTTLTIEADRYFLVDDAFAEAEEDGGEEAEEGVEIEITIPSASLRRRIRHGFERILGVFGREKTVGLDDIAEIAETYIADIAQDKGWYLGGDLAEEFPEVWKNVKKSYPGIEDAAALIDTAILPKSAGKNAFVFTGEGVRFKWLTAKYDIKYDDLYAMFGKDALGRETLYMYGDPSRKRPAALHYDEYDLKALKACLWEIQEII